jgi:hypothetical protein
MLGQAARAEEEQPPLVGSWKIVSMKLVVDGEALRDLYGPRPKGYLVATPEGRFISMLTASTRKSDSTEDERVVLFRSMYAYAGSYHVDGSKLVVDIDTSWNEAWNGTEQVRAFRIEGDQLLIDMPAPAAAAAQYPGKMALFRAVWERDKAK